MSDAVTVWVQKVRRRGSFQRSQRVREALAGYLCISPWFVGFLIFTAGAMAYSFGLSFFKSDMLTSYRFIGLKNYQTLVEDPLFWKSMKVTFYYTFGTVVPRTFLALLIAMLLNQNLPGRGIWRTLYYTPSLVSGVAVSVLWIWLLNPMYGLINTALNSVLGIEGPRWIYSEVWAMPAFILMGLWGVGGSMLLYLAGLQGIPTALYEAAHIDGAGGLRCFFHITIPMLSPTIFFNLIMNIIGSFQVFTQAYIMTKGGPNNATLSMVLYIFRKAFEHFSFGYGSALAWVLFAVILVFTALVIRSSDAWVYYEGELKR
jgi:multiple sugar transport system permease protein